jgi:diaminopimelate decarboxylase
MAKRKIFMNISFDYEHLAQKYGLPLYVYDTDVMDRQLQRLRKAFSVKNLHIHYACKALNNVSILRWMKNSGTGLDTVSIEEVKLGLFAGFEPQEIMFTPNCVSLSEILEGVNLGVKINIDNLSILEQFGHVKPDYPVCIRINPHIMAGGNLKTSVGHIDSKFGISIHQIPLLKRILESTGQKVEGTHMHTGSDILDADVFLSGAEILLDLAMDFPDLEFVDFGSGFKVPYKPGDIETDVEELGKKISKRFNEFCKKKEKDIALVFEPGKYLVSAAGYFLAHVNVVKQTTSTVFAGLDTGLNHLIRPMFYDAYHHILNLSNPDGKKRIYTVVGYICETDTFGSNRSIAEIREGDVLCFMNAGAYGYTMASNYNSRFRPAEVLIHKGKDYLIREREDFEDLIRKQILPDFLNS